MNAKRLLALLLALVMVLSLTACGGSKKEEAEPTEAPVEAADEPETAEEPEAPEEPEDVEEPETAEEPEAPEEPEDAEEPADEADEASAEAPADEADTETDAEEPAAEEEPAEEKAPAEEEAPAEGGYTGPDWEAIDAMDAEEASDAVYDWNLGEYYEMYQTAKAEIGDTDRRMALMALAEAKLMESAVMVPVSANGGSYAIGRVVPRTNASIVLWGMDNYRYHTMLITNELIKIDDRTKLLELWNEAATAADYLSSAKEYLEGQGYTFQDTYNLYNSEIVNIWDTIATSYNSDAMFISGTYDNLLEYDCKGVQQPGLAEGYEVSEDGLTYTFHIRKGVKWVDQQGTEIGEVTADDWVASMEHLLDNNDALGYLMTVSDGCGMKNYEAYLAGECEFEDVGVKAIDDYTLEYTLEAPFPAFPTMMGYSIFAPLNRDFYRSQGGTFGAEGEEYTPGDYGKTPANIAYCGPYLITNFTAQNTTRYEANPTYWNADAVNIKTIVYSYNDFSDPMRAYNECKENKVANCALSAELLTHAQSTDESELPEGETESYFDLYHYQSATDASTFPAWANLNRGTWTNYDDTGVGVSPNAENEEEHARSRSALNNQHFRLALAYGLDRGAYRAVSAGEDLKYAAMRNSYTPGTFLYLANDVTVEINGTETTFAAGTSYGAMEQAQLDADGYPIKVWDPTADNGAGSGDGYDGWYNPEEAVKELDLAIAELAEIGVEISEEHPIYLDFPYGTFNNIYEGRAQAVKQSVEASLGGKVVFNLVGIDQDVQLNSATYRVNYGSETNFDWCIASGWTPDYGDAQSYLDTMNPGGYMVKLFGLY